MSDPLRRHKYAFNRILIPAARILSPEFNAAYLFFTGSQIEILRNLVAYATRETTFVDEYHVDYYITPDSDDMDDITAIVADLENMLMTIVLGYYDAYACVKDVKAQDVYGGTFTSGAWRTRDLNTEESDPQNILTLSSNQIVLQPGTYRCFISCPAMRCQSHVARLYSITDTAIVLQSSAGFSNASYDGDARCFIIGRFTITVATTLEVQHQCGQTQATYGLGFISQFGDSVYTIAEFWRET